MLKITSSPALMIIELEGCSLMKKLISYSSVAINLLCQGSRQIVAHLLIAEGNACDSVACNLGETEIMATVESFVHQGHVQ